MKLTKNQWYIVGLVALIAIWYFFIRKKPKTTAILEENNYVSGRGSQIVEPIVSFVIAMKGPIIPPNGMPFPEWNAYFVSTTNIFRERMRQNGNNQFAQPIVTFLNVIFYDNSNLNRNNAQTAFTSSMRILKGIEFAAPIISFVNDIKNGGSGSGFGNDEIAINNFRNKMQGI